MPANTTGFDNSLTGESPRIQDKISDAASQVKNKVSNLGSSAAEKLDQKRDSAAEGLQKAASALHSKADSMPGGEKVAGLAHTTAERLNSTADYVRQHNVNRMMADVETLVKNNPGPALLGAAVVGFLVGRAFRDND